MMTAAARVRVGQINLGGSAHATQELRQIIFEMKLDLLLLQDPYSIDGAIRGLGGRVKIATGRGPKPMAAIVVADPSASVVIHGNLTSSHLVCAEVTHPRWGTFSAVSQYCPPSRDIQTDMCELSTALTSLTGRKIVVGLDTNAHSPLWGPYHVSNPRGGAAEEVFALHALTVLNDPAGPPTFVGYHGGTSHVDVSLTSAQFSSPAADWAVHPNISSSDHSLIVFVLETRRPVMTSAESALPRPFRTRPESWAPFQQQLEREMTQLDRKYRRRVDDPDVHEAASDLQEAIITAAERTIGRGRPGALSDRSAPWWTAELSRLRAESRRSRRSLGAARKRAGHFGGNTRCTDPEVVRLHEEYKTKRKEYSRAARKASQDCWMKFVTTTADDPWGPAAAAVRRPGVSSRVVHALRRSTGGALAPTASEIACDFIDRMTRNDDPTLDNAQQLADRIEAYRAPPASSDEALDEMIPTRDEIACLIRSRPHGKAPGPDCIDSRMLLAAWPVMATELVDLFSECYRKGVFPNCWKTGLLTAIPKAGSKKPPDDPGHYRPIILLSEIGKLLERTLCCRVREALSAGTPLNDRQFGFTPGRSTEDLLAEVRRTAVNSKQNFVVAILLDISGAFDCASWYRTLLGLKRRGVSGNVLRLVQSYLSDRFVQADTGQELVGRRMSMGCPQGSVLGPLLWNVLFDDIFAVQLPVGCSVVAYADDVTLLIEADKRVDLQFAARDALDALLSWSVGMGLTFAKEKTEAIVLKGSRILSKLVDFRGLNIFFGDTKVAFSNPVRLLGVHLDQEWSFSPHIRRVCLTAARSMLFLNRLSGDGWGKSWRSRKVVYGSVFVSKVAYAAGFWAQRSSVGHLKRFLTSGQRAPLLTLTKAYRTTSSDALQILAAEAPLDLTIQERAVSWLFKRDLPISVGGKEILREPDSTLTTCRRLAAETALETWEERWAADPEK
ncbi:MAG: reverse transcriptase domain-containing protein, partial [Allorhizobium sp.]